MPQGGIGQGAASLVRLEGAVAMHEDAMALHSLVAFRRQVIRAHRCQLTLAIGLLVLRFGYAERTGAIHHCRHLRRDALDLVERRLVHGSRAFPSETVNGIVIEGRETRQQKAPVATRRATADFA